MTWFLEFDQEDEHCKLELEPGQILKIGRGTGSDTQIPDPALSRLHCELELSDGSAVLRDLSSSSGTFVGGQKVTEQAISPNQSFRAGNTEFKLVSDSPLDQPTVVVQEKPADESLAAKLEARGKLDRFELKKLINKSGNNLVYKAVDTESGETVAIKVLPMHDGTEEDEERFMRAMRTLHKIHDPWIVQLLRAARKKNYCWVAMEWFSSGSVKDRMVKLGVNGTMEWRSVWSIAHCVCQSLHVLEREGIVHRSIRPTNILYRDKDETWVLSDLVVARAEELDAARMVTRQVFLPDNLAYTAPERLLGSESNAHSIQADIYSLGAVLTECLIGQPPYGYGDLRELLPRLKEQRKIVSRESQIGINELFVDFVNKMTEPDPENRFESALELWQQADRVGQLSGLRCV